MTLVGDPRTGGAVSRDAFGGESERARKAIDIRYKRQLKALERAREVKDRIARIRQQEVAKRTPQIDSIQRAADSGQITREEANRRIRVLEDESQERINREIEIANKEYQDIEQ